MKDRRAREKYIHLAFVWGLVLKAAFAVGEIATGAGAFFASEALVMRLARAMTQEELSEDPRDLVANYVVRMARHFSTSAAHFMGVYLVSHGLVKLALIAALLMRKTWAYPIAIAVFGGFIAYQVYRYSVTHAPALVALTIVDAIVIALTWHEYRYIRGGSPSRGNRDLA